NARHNGSRTRQCDRCRIVKITTFVRPVTASKSRACRAGHTSGPCRWLFSATRPVGDVKSLKALHRYNVLKTPAVGGITVWKWPAAFKTTNALPSIHGD